MVAKGLGSAFLSLFLEITRFLSEVGIFSSEFTPEFAGSKAMKVHPVPKKRNITVRYDIASALSQAGAAVACRQKKLRRLPHIFAKVLELPFRSDADVLIEETHDFFRFIVPTDDVSGDNIRAHTIQIYPGVTKIVIRGDGLVDSPLTELELDLWRFRLPASTLPGMASAAFSDGELVVTVPKGPHEEDGEGEDAGDIGAEQLVFVQ
ncbi:PREDICTED: uncharacterized protein LOC109158737 [Ipomoea nil]|uniref:uncharacterized protein LOC109158737 n=1 Tax=Ipomoea nil TaxID=35883 RepID=UPI000900AB4B|nr:PREDICTED: uncharacterized protein LOC109158737 [Ipomoea nil]